MKGGQIDPSEETTFKKLSFIRVNEYRNTFDKYYY